MRLGTGPLDPEWCTEKDRILMSLVHTVHAAALHAGGTHHSALGALGFAHGGPWGGGGFPWLRLIVPLFWLIVVVVALILFARARRRGWVGPWAAAGRGPSAEQILAERFARGEVDEIDYRARLEVLRGSSRP